MKALELTDIKRVYNGHPVLDIDNLAVEKGEKIAVVGPNGSGKTTLLMIAALLSPPDKGFVKVDNEKVDWKNIDKWRSKITLVLQEPYFFSGSLIKNMLFGFQGEKISKIEMKSRITKNIDRLGLTGLEKRSPKTFSSGERKRAAIARALCRNTPIILLDEPFAHIDSQSIEVVETVIRNINSDRTVVFSTHEIARAHELADRIITLHDGRISPWTPENVFRMTAKKVSDGSELSTSGGLKIYYPHILENEWQYKVTVNAKEVIISKDELESSAQNRFKGVIKKIETAGENQIEITVQCPPDLNIKATVTSRAIRSLNCVVGDNVWVNFKSSAIHVFENNKEKKMGQALFQSIERSI